MTDAWVEDHGVQNPAIYDCFPKFLKHSLQGRGDALSAIVRKMSGAVADRFRLKDRRYVTPGAFYGKESEVEFVNSIHFMHFN